MKILSIAIPCYNSSAYMRKCIESLLPGGEDVEILIVNDGSQKDDTASIADEYASKYPTICKAIHKENGGHGDAVCAGLAAATGTYFKVVDSDDWVDGESYAKILDTIKRFIDECAGIDMFISNFVYEKEGAERKKVMNYRHVIEPEKILTWDDVGHFLPGQYIIMHSVIYRTQMLRDCGLSLPKHTFYVDNIFVYQPLVYVKKLYYIDTNFYRYYIGREDQSVNEQVMISRIDQQIRVTKLMIGYCDPYQVSSKRLSKYMILYIEIMMVICSILAIRSKSDENLAKKKEIWQYLKEQNLRLYIRIRYGILGQGMNLPGRGGRKLSSSVYKIARKFYGFN